MSESRTAAVIGKPPRLSGCLRWLASGMTALLVAACGGGQGGAESNSDASSVTSRVRTLAATETPSALPNVAVVGITKVRETRIGRTEFEYEFRVNLQNTGQSATDVVASLVQVGAGTQIVDGVANFGAVAGGRTATSLDTVILRQNRLIPFNTAELTWNVAGTANQFVLVTPTMDNSLQVQGTLAIASTQSEKYTSLMGTPIRVSVAPDHVVYGLDESGRIAVAASIDNGGVVFSAEGSALAFGTVVLKSLFPERSIEDIRRRLREADGISGLVTDIRNALLSGKNPLDENSVRQGFGRILKSTAAVLGASAPLRRPLTVAKRRAEKAYEPSILETSTFKVSLGNNFYGSPSFEKKVILRNTSALNFEAALLDTTGAQRASESLAGAGSSIWPVLPTEIAKTFPGSFTVRLMIDDRANKVEFVKAALGFTKLASSECIDAIAKIASEPAIDAVFKDLVFKNDALEWLKQLLSIGWTATTACDQSVAVSTAMAVVRAYTTFADILGFVRLSADRLLLPDVIEDVGVCLSTNEFQISCVETISVSPHHPMMPNATQPIAITFRDKNFNNTSATPYGMNIQYSDPGLFTLSESLGQVISNGRVGTGDVTLTDPSTGANLTLRVTVTHGKLDKALYVVSPLASVELNLVDPSSGARVYRSREGFDVFLSDSKFGEFTFASGGIGSIVFTATNLNSLGPLDIFLGNGYSGSKLQVGRSGMIGDRLTFARRWPTPDTPFLAWKPDSIVSTVAAGPSDAFIWSGWLSVDPEESTIEFTNRALTGWCNGSCGFDGIVISGFSSPIESVSVNNQMGGVVSVSHTGSEVLIGLNSQSLPQTYFQPGGKFILTIKLRQ